MVTWQFNRETKQADILIDGVVVESVELAKAASRVSFHRGETAKTGSYVEASPFKRRNRSR